MVKSRIKPTLCSLVLLLRKIKGARLQKLHAQLAQRWVLTSFPFHLIATSPLVSSFHRIIHVCIIATCIIYARVIDTRASPSFASSFIFTSSLLRMIHACICSHLHHPSLYHPRTLSPHSHPHFMSFFMLASSALAAVFFPSSKFLSM